MLERLQKAAEKELERSRLALEKLAVDQAERYDDGVASTTDWAFMVHTGGGFRSRRLVQVLHGRLQFKATWRGLAFGVAFAAPGFAMLAAGIWHAVTARGGTLGLLMSGLAFGAAGIVMLAGSLLPVVFDRDSGYFWRGRTAPRRDVDVDAKAARLQDVHAVQLLTGWRNSSGTMTSGYNVHEVNLILHDGSRVHVVGHGGSIEQLREEITTVAEFLNVPVWDADLSA